MSIPSIFSQLYEQASAFSNITFNFPFASPRKDSEDERFVSYCLDLFELIFMRGAEMHVVHINKGDIQQLSLSPNPNHQLLASIIEEDLQHPCLRNIADWYLFSWEDILLGGTSTMTIVYSSPNIISEFAQRNIMLRGTCGNILFQDVVPLHNRGRQFRDFIYEYYDLLADSYGNPIYVNGIPIFHTPIRVEESDYMITPHKNVKGKLPLVLSMPGLFGARYILNMLWDPHYFRIPQDIMLIPLEDRILPGTRIKYPFITIDDFLERRIIQLPKEIDSKCFITCAIGKSSYLLPIKMRYFEYFTPADLWNSLFVEISEERNSVEVSLKIPVRGGVIEFRRSYQDENIVKFNLNIAVTPFYSLEGETYHLLSAKDKQVKIYVGNTETQTIVNGITYTQRFSNDIFEVGGYTIRDAWDFISIVSQRSDSYENIEGILIPQLIKGNAPRQECTFCVDMSDSYTTIMHMRRDDHLVHPLSLDETEHFLGILCPEDVSFESLIKRYFFETPSSKRLYSSFKNLLNVTHDVKQNPRNGSFLENYSIMLDYDDFPRRGDETIIIPSLHNLNHIGIEYLRIYFEGLLFIMKQEAIWQYNSYTFDLRVAVPPYLCAAERDCFEHIVREAHHASGTNQCNDTMFVSGPAAIALFTHFSIGLPKDFVNINIDSMHTLISHCDNDRRVLTVHVDMGIGDLFQNVRSVYGNDESFVCRILQQYLNGNGIYSQDETQIIDSHIHYDQWSLFDIFENESDIAKKSLIMHCGQLGACAMEIETIYLVGLFYYLGRYFGERNIRQPHAVVFSGLGSKYLSQYFRNDRSVKYLLDSVMSLVQGDDYESRNTRLLFYDNPTLAISKGLMTDGMVVDEEFYCFYGLVDNVNNPVHLREVIDGYVRDDIHRTFRHFIDVLSSNELRTVLSRELNISLGIVLNNINALDNMAMNSVDICLHEKMEVYKQEGRCNDALFFWSLKHCLYELLKNNC